MAAIVPAGAGPFRVRGDVIEAPRGHGPLRAIARRPMVLLALATLALLGFTALKQLDVAFNRMHVPNEIAYDVGDLVGPSRLTFQGADWQTAHAAWKDYEGDADSVTLRVDTGLRWHVALDSLLVAWSFALLLGSVAWKAWERSGRLPVSDRWATLKPAIRQVAGYAMVLSWALMITDYVENGLILALSRFGASRGWSWLITVASTLKWVFLVGALVPLLVVFVAIHASKARMLSPRASFRDRWPSLYRLLALRAQVGAALVVILLLVLPGDMGTQIVDVLLLWTDRPRHLIAAGIVLVVTIVATVLGGRLALDRYASRPGIDTLGPAVGPLFVAGGLAIAGLAWWLTGAAAPNWLGRLLPLAIGLLVFGLLCIPSRVRAISRPPSAVDGSSIPVTPGALLPVLAALAGWVLAMLLVRAAMILLVDGHGWNAALYAFFAAVAAALGWAGGTIASLSDRRWKSWMTVVLAACGLLIGVLWIAGLVNPWAIGDLLGTTGVVLVFSCVLGFVLLLLVLLSDAVAARGPLALVGFSRLPAVSLFVIWIFLTSAIDTGFAFHDARLSTERAVTPVRVSEAFQAWLDQSPGTGARQLVFVASAGGGVRAAYWGALGMSCLFGDPPQQDDDPASTDPSRDSAFTAAACPRLGSEGSVFAASGISGGSVGLAMDKLADGSGDALEAMKEDYLAPTLARFLFFDLLNSWLRWEPTPDRAEVLERAIERSWPVTSKLSEDFFATQVADGKPTFPILMMNGATIDDRCRLNGSVLDAAVDPLDPARPRSVDGVSPLADTSCSSLGPFSEPGQLFASTTSPTASTSTTIIDPDAASRADVALVRTKDLHDVNCDAAGTEHDLRISTVAMLSARFPFVLPSAGLHHCRDDGNRGGQRRTFDVDGGALESSASKPLEELWAAMAPMVAAENERAPSRCIEPRLIIFDNGYQSTARADPGSRPLELFVPSTEAGIAYEGGTAAARQEAALGFARFFGGAACGGNDELDARVAFLNPTQQLGVQAPLGWTLSKFARDDMQEQLAFDWNRCQIQLVATWFNMGSNVPRC